MLARTIDNGAKVQELRAFGPPDVVALDPIAGNATAVHTVRRFHSVIESITFKIVTDATVANRRPIVAYAEESDQPFAEVTNNLAITATITMPVCFAVNLPTNVGTLSVLSESPLPELLLAPGNTVTLSILAGVAGDAISNIRLRRQRYILVDCDDAYRDVDAAELVGR